MTSIWTQTLFILLLTISTTIAIDPLTSTRQIKDVGTDIKAAPETVESSLNAAPETANPDTVDPTVEAGAKDSYDEFMDDYLWVIVFFAEMGLIGLITLSFYCYLRVWVRKNC